MWNMTARITGCGTSEGEDIDIQPVEYRRGQQQYALVKRIAELEAKVDDLENGKPAYHCPKCDSWYSEDGLAGIK
jgi:hypothetical protein